MKVQTKDLIDMNEIERKALKQLVVTVSEKVIARLLEKQAEGKKGWDSEGSKTDIDLIRTIGDNYESIPDDVKHPEIPKREYEERVLDIICASILLWNRI